MYLLNSNYADLSFLFTIHPGEKTNPHLRSEYLAVLETDNATPYYLNLHNREVAHTFILGMTGSGNGDEDVVDADVEMRPEVFVVEGGPVFFEARALTVDSGGEIAVSGDQERGARRKRGQSERVAERDSFARSGFESV